jgi:hypothetical protein
MLHIDGSLMPFAASGERDKRSDTMSHRDSYIKTPAARARLRLPPTKESVASIEPELKLTEDEAVEAALYLEELDWKRGLTRDDVRTGYRELPLAIYLRLPDSKVFTSAEEVLHAASLAASRAEGEFMGAKPDYPAEQSVADGGPPGWGADVAVLGGEYAIDGGSAEDRAAGSFREGDDGA